MRYAIHVLKILTEFQVKTAKIVFVIHNFISKTQLKYVNYVIPIKNVKHAKIQIHVNNVTLKTTGH